MASWKLSALVVFCVIFVLVAESESRRGGRGRGVRRRGNHVTVSGEEQSEEIRPDGNDARGRRRPGGGRRRVGRRRGERRRTDRPGFARPICRSQRRGRHCRGPNGGAPSEEEREQLMNGLSNSINSFSLNVYIEMGKPAVNVDNFVFSPYSVYSALTMAMLGAKGRTKQEMKTGLNVQRRQRVHQAMNIYNATLAMRNDDNVTLSVANAIYVKTGFNYKPAFTSQLRDFYNSAVQEFQPVDPEEPINQWVEEKTDGEIEDFLDDGAIGESTMMMLINAVYFKGLWKKPFDEDHTVTLPFHVSASETANVEMMVKMDSYKVQHSSVLDASILELPYAGDHYSMFIILPNEATRLDDVAQRITPDTFNGELNFENISSAQVHVKIPKFSLDTAQSMKDILQELSINSAFGDRANFKKMVAERRGSVYIKDVMHRAVIELDEDGTVAAAATGVSFERHSMPMSFHANKPFMFIIRDKSTGVNLFMGRFANPEGGNLAM